MRTAAQLTEEEMASYRASGRERTERERVELREREERAWELAREAATLLRGHRNAGCGTVMERFRVAAGRIRQELVDSGIVVQRGMHDFYAGFERVFEHLASSIDKSLPSGSDRRHVVCNVYAFTLDSTELDSPA